MSASAGRAAADGAVSGAVSAQAAETEGAHTLDIGRLARAAQRLFTAAQWMFVFALLIAVALGAGLVRGDMGDVAQDALNNIIRFFLFGALLAYAALYALMDYGRRFWLAAAVASALGLGAMLIWGGLAAIGFEADGASDPDPDAPGVVASVLAFALILGPPLLWFLRQFLGAWALLRAGRAEAGAPLAAAMAEAERISAARPGPSAGAETAARAPRERLLLDGLGFGGRVLGRGLVALSIGGVAAVVLAALVIIAEGEAADAEPSEPAATILTIGLFALPVLGLTLDFGRRLSQPSAARALADDDRPPVLLLRSFTDDAATIPSRNALRRFLYLGLYGKVRLETAIADELARLGPFIAVGQPGEALPALGAARAYLDDADWQAQVIAWIGAARLVVMIGGATPWVGWELSQVAAAGRLSRLIILLPPARDAEAAAERWRALRERLAGVVGGPWGAFPEQAQAEHAIAVFATRDGRLRVLASRRPRQADYEIAVRLAIAETLA